MTDISVVTTSYQPEDRSWLASNHGTEFTPSITLDVSAFTAATHYPNGYIKSGIVLGKITATGLYGPYVDAAADGTGTAAGILFSSVNIPSFLDLTKDTACAMLTHGFVDETRLPVAYGAVGGGFIDASGKADLKFIWFARA